MADKKADRNKDKCAHPSCACQAAADSKYCSAFCEGNAEHPDITCGCGHAACTTTATATTGYAAGGTRTY